jgi:WD40 repeat protein
MDLIGSYCSDTSDDDDPINLACGNISVNQLVVPSQPGTVFHSSLSPYVSKRKSEQVAVPNDKSQSYSTLSSHLGASHNTSNAAHKLKRWIGHTKAIMSLNWHPFNTNILLSASLDGLVKVWNVLSTVSPIALHAEHKGGINAAQWLTASHVISGGFDRCLCYTDMEVMKTLKCFKLDENLSSLAVHQTSNNLILTGVGNSIQLWDMRSGSIVKNFIGIGGNVLDKECCHTYVCGLGL